MERPLTKNIRTDGQPVFLKEYESQGGYKALPKALKLQPDEVIELVKKSNLKGRGGAGFNTGLKWSFVPKKGDFRHKYLVANGDEMEPGTYKDRLLIEGDPHQLIEGMILSSWAIQADEGFIFIRGEYTYAAEVMSKALAEAKAAGYLGNDILRSGFNFNLHLHTSVGRYICGEETALLNSLEGKRANPRTKPPFPQVSGLFGQPTIVNNIETLCNIPHIINNGAEWFNQLSLTPGDGGTKLFGASGKVKKPGVWELPFGIPMRQIIEENAGGMRDGLKFRGCLPGGASTDFLTEQHLDLKMDYNSVAAAGSRLATGLMIVLDDKTCPVGMVLNMIHFFAQESCGWCTPCREGLPWTEKILRKIEDGRGEMNDLDQLESMVRFMGPGNTFCALAPGATAPLGSALKYFRDDFITHIRDKKCSWK
ncbi:MAG TPA: NADH-quinone oxidoreductase subunit NuoF [Bacteroidales bacterium]|nr:NADH-quinone oxidoreductase subunit NuoF [Bacteroidales bacterium]HRZ48724.1 NADH-quinone oxidoreductase subunit NuoF [Bacteroidales bacterium]